MTSKLLFGFLIAILLVPSVAAVNYVEDFNSYNIIGQINQKKPVPTPVWYNYNELSDVGNVVATAPIIEGTQSFRFIQSNSTNFTNGQGEFDLATPIQLTSFNFTVQGSTLNDTGVGSQQVISIESGFPVRRLVQFYVFCTNDSGNSSFNGACQLRVRWLQVDGTGQVLIDYNGTVNRFQINATIDWKTPQFCLRVNNVSDGCFPFFELPQNVQTFRFTQQRADIPMNITLDPLSVQGAANVTVGATTQDAAGGIKGFATDMHFTSSTSLFIFGLVVFIMMMAALIMAMFSHGKSNTIAPASGFFSVVLIFWLIQMKFWPDWIGITFIIIVSSMIGLILRRVMLGVTNANNGPSIVIGALGYFIICATFLSMSGYAATTITVPTSPSSQDSSTSQSFTSAIADCSLNILTLGLAGFGCSQQSISHSWKTITDVFGWIQEAFNFLFQLLTFQLPIPTVLNMMIVLPPAATLAAYAIQIIRG